MVSFIQKQFLLFRCHNLHGNNVDIVKQTNGPCYFNLCTNYRQILQKSIDSDTGLDQDPVSENDQQNIHFNIFRRQHTAQQHEQSPETQFQAPSPELAAASRPEEGAGKNNLFTSLIWHQVSQLVSMKIFILLILTANMNCIHIKKEWSVFKTSR